MTKPVRYCLVAGLSLLLTACSTPLFVEDAVIGPSYNPSNFSTNSAPLPEGLHRVAVLPMTDSVGSSLGESGRETMEPILRAELAKRKSFEWVSATAEQMKQWAGKPSLSAEEKIPPQLLKQAKDSLGCDGVLFVRLTNYKPYKPPLIGWSMKLVDCKDARIWWAIDEVFDAGDGAVANAARRYYQREIRQPKPMSDSQSIFSSPRRFGQYTLDAVVSTMPSR
jgi:hypothetical protein